MAVPTAITDLSTTAASNSPAGGDTVGTTMDDFIRAHASFIAKLYAEDATKAGLQAQTYTAYTTGGSSTAYTLTPAPALSALAENQEFDVEFHTAAGATPTLAISGLTAKSLKYRDSTGAKQAVTSTQIPSGWRSRVTYDGTDYIVREVPVVSEITNATAQASTSGTAIDFTGIPAGTKRITVMFSSVSTNGTSPLIIQIGDAGGFETSGYVGGSGNRGGEGTSTAGFTILYSPVAANAHSGAVILSLEKASAFTWTLSGCIALDSTGQPNFSAGAKSLSAELTQVRITAVNGTDAFDAGEINISYE